MEEILSRFYGKKNDMVHTKLDARFDFQKCQLYGKVWLTLTPHFYDVDSLKLDAKGMDIHSVELANAEKNIPLKYRYDSLALNIHLGKTFSEGEKYTVFIDYTAKPNELKVKENVSFDFSRGMYFIDPDDKDKDKPTQIWTQGETENNSVWIPIIDKPIFF